MCHGQIPRSAPRNATSGFVLALGMGERTESSDESSAENEASKLKPPKKKLKLSVPKDKESRWQFVDEATEAAFGKQVVPKTKCLEVRQEVLYFSILTNLTIQLG